MEGDKVAVGAYLSNLEGMTSKRHAVRRKFDQVINSYRDQGHRRACGKGKTREGWPEGTGAIALIPMIVETCAAYSGRRPRMVARRPEKSTVFFDTGYRGRFGRKGRRRGREEGKQGKVSKKLKCCSGLPLRNN